MCEIILRSVKRDSLTSADLQRFRFPTFVKVFCVTVPFFLIGDREDAVEKAVITSEMIAAGGDDLDEVRQARGRVGDVMKYPPQGLERLGSGKWKVKRIDAITEWFISFVHGGWWLVVIARCCLGRWGYWAGWSWESRKAPLLFPFSSWWNITGISALDSKNKQKSCAKPLDPVVVVNVSCPRQCKRHKKLWVKPESSWTPSKLQPG